MKRMLGIVLILIVLAAFTPLGCFADVINTCNPNQTLPIVNESDGYTTYTLGDSCNNITIADISISGKVLLDLNGKTLSANSVKCADNASSCSLEIKGTGTLTVSGSIRVENDLNISGGQVTVAVSSGFGIYADYGNIAISGGQVTVTGSTSFGIYAQNGTITISGKDTQVTVTGSPTYGIYAQNGTITISGKDTQVTVSGSTTFGIHAKNGITISGGTVTATGGKYGIYAGTGSDITISGGTVENATGSEYGIYANQNITIEKGGTVKEASGGTYGIYAKNGSITISGQDTQVTASGNNRAVEGSVKNTVPGIGWEDTAGTQGITSIQTTEQDTGQSLLFKKVRFPAPSAAVTFEVVNGKWDDGTKEDKTGIVYSTDGTTWTLPEDQIPAVDKSLKGNWDTDPSTVTPITPGKTYTYTYKDKAAVTTAPTARDLTYTGKEQELVNKGEASGGTMQYALGTDAETAPAADQWDTAIPSGSDAVTYYVWYKAVGDPDHNDSDPKWLQVRIKDESELPPPLFDPAEGSYDSAQTVKISCAEEGATIYYTTDGSEPTVSSTRYSGPIEVSESLTIKAFAVKANMKNSIVNKGAYTITKETMELPAEISVVQGNGEKGVPDDVKARTIRLTIRLKQNGEVKLSSAPIELAVTPGGNTKPAEISGVVFTPNVPDFKETCGNYEYEVAVTPGEVKADIAGAGDDGPAYLLKAAAGSPDCEKFVLTLYWNNKAAFEPEVIRVVALPEDEIGAYQLRGDGTKEYLIFQTYDICMAYLGRDELCRGPERCYHK